MDVDLNDIISDYLTTGSMINVAKKHHIGVKRVKSILIENNINCGRGKHLPVDDIISLYREHNESTCVIAKKYKVDAGTILRILKTNGVDTHIKTDKDISGRIIEMYGAGYNMKQIGNVYNVSPSTVMNILNRYNIPHHSNRKINEIDYESIINLYRDKKISTPQIAKMYNTTTKSICDILKRNNIERNNRQGDFNLNINFWKKIDNIESAYFLGWILTDGNIWGNQIRLSLNSKDEEVLYNFRDAVNSSVNIRKTYKKNNNTGSIEYTSTISICCSQWVDDLSLLHITPNKTLTCAIPDISDNLLPHFIRGCIEGDGYISKNGDKLGFCGNLQVVTRLHDILVDKLKVYNVKIRNYGNNLYEVVWCSKRDVNCIGNYIYKDAGKLYMKRKFDNWISNPYNKNNYHVNTEVNFESNIQNHRNA